MCCDPNASSSLTRKSSVVVYRLGTSALRGTERPISALSITWPHRARYTVTTWGRWGVTAIGKFDVCSGRAHCLWRRLSKAGVGGGDGLNRNCRILRCPNAYILKSGQGRRIFAENPIPFFRARASGKNSPRAVWGFRGVRSAGRIRQGRQTLPYIIGRGSRKTLISANGAAML